jgi:hypothetical protein
VRAVLFAVVAILIAIARAFPAEPDAWMLLDRTVWVDIGIGKNPATMSRKAIAALKRCKEPTLYFEKMGKGLAETLYTGMTMRSEYPRMSLTRNVGTIKILLYNAGSTQPTETLQLISDGAVLVQQTRGFRPRIFLRCDASPPVRKKH